MCTPWELHVPSGSMFEIINYTLQHVYKLWVRSQSRHSRLSDIQRRVALFTSTWLMPHCLLVSRRCPQPFIIVGSNCSGRKRKEGGQGKESRYDLLMSLDINCTVLLHLHFSGTALYQVLRIEDDIAKCRISNHHMLFQPIRLWDPVPKVSRFLAKNSRRMTSYPHYSTHLFVTKR